MKKTKRKNSSKKKTIKICRKSNQKTDSPESPFFVSERGDTMSVAGVICECNPPHKGHEYLFRRACDTADGLVAVMSGVLTQRGECAILSPQARAKMLLRIGADAVIELPFPYSPARGEIFGRAGVFLLSQVGVTDLWFGSECGDIGRLQTLAEISDRDEFLSSYREKVRAGEGTTSAYIELLQEKIGDKLPIRSNDLLGVSYLKAIKLLNSEMTPHTVRRIGSDYLSQEMSGDFPSATAIRSALSGGGFDAVQNCLNAENLAILQAEIEKGYAPADTDKLDGIFLAFLRTFDAEKIRTVPELSGGLAERLVKCAWKVKTFSELLSECSRNCPTSRIRRGLLFAILDVCEEDLQTLPTYAKLLAVNQNGRKIIAENRHGDRIGIVTRQSDYADDKITKRQKNLNERALSIWTLTQPSPQSPADLLRQTAYIDFEG